MVCSSPHGLWDAAVHKRRHAQSPGEQLEDRDVGQSGWHDSGEGPGSTEGNYINWLTFSDNAKSVVEDVMRIRHHPLVPNDIPIYGYIYDVKSGNLVEVQEATTAGKASWAVTMLDPPKTTGLVFPLVS